MCGYLSEVTHTVAPLISMEDLGAVRLFSRMIHPQIYQLHILKSIFPDVFVRFFPPSLTIAAHIEWHR